MLSFLGLSLNNTSDSSSQTPDNLSYSTPRKVVLRTALKEANEKIKSLEKTVATLSKVLAEGDSIDIFLKQCQKYLSPALLVFVKSHLMLRLKIMAVFNIRFWSLDINKKTVNHHKHNYGSFAF